LKHASVSLSLVSFLSVAHLGCSSGSMSPAPDSGVRDATTVDVVAETGFPIPDATTPDAPDDTAAPACDGSVPADAGPPAGSFCALPGSVLWTGDCAAPHVVPGGPASAPDLTWLHLPAGFCAHYYGNVGDARQLRVAPGGEIFVASPTTPTTGGFTLQAIAGIVVLPDDNHDGVADQNIVFVSGIPSVQGLMFANGSFYYQEDVITDAGTRLPNIMSVPYKSGDRKPSGTPQVVTTITAEQASEHWPKVFDQASDGTIYISNGGSQADKCLSNWPTRGAIFALGDGGTTNVVSVGFRNPIAMRCETKHNVCLVTELALDYSGDHGGREKLVPVRPGDNWGYPCCATKDVPYASVSYEDGAVPDCSGVAPESDSFIIGNTPFGVDFETGKWPAPWTDRVFVTLHGAAGSWSGARLVSIGLDPTTGLPLPGTELDSGSAPNSLLEFATGWDDGLRAHGRPAPITFAPDGRMFLGNDNSGDIVWIAPIDLPQN